MIIKQTISEIAKSQREELSIHEKSVKREKLKDIEVNLPFAIVLAGIRRCGKSTLLKQVMKNVDNFYYFNFDDPRASNFELGDFLKLDEVFSEEFGKSDLYLFDEIQNVKKWELFVRGLLDKKKHVLITGSNASLLSKELGTRLTGRHLRLELFPFSYKEFLSFTSKKAGVLSFLEYFEKGGFPEYLKYGKSEILRELFEDIILRDIVVRHKLRVPKIIKEMALYLITNAGKEFSYNNLAKTFNLGSTNTAVAFVSYLEDSYLLFTVPKFDYSLKKQAVNPKKVYSIDTGLSKINSASLSQDVGRHLENVVFLNLRKANKDIYYFKGVNECDFLVRDRNKISQAVQVCYEMTEDNKERELKGLVEALKDFNLDKGLIITNSQEDKFELEGKSILVKPVWKWLLEGDN